MLKYHVTLREYKIIYTCIYDMITIEIIRKYIAIKFLSGIHYVTVFSGFRPFSKNNFETNRDLSESGANISN